MERISPSWSSTFAIPIYGECLAGRTRICSYMLLFGVVSDLNNVHNDNHCDGCQTEAATTAILYRCIHDIHVYCITMRDYCKCACGSRDRNRPDNNSKYRRTIDISPILLLLLQGTVSYARRRNLGEPRPIHGCVAAKSYGIL